MKSEERRVKNPCVKGRVKNQYVKGTFYFFTFLLFKTMSIYFNFSIWKFSFSVSVNSSVKNKKD